MCMGACAPRLALQACWAPCLLHLIGLIASSRHTLRDAIFLDYHQFFYEYIRGVGLNVLVPFPQAASTSGNASSDGSEDVYHKMPWLERGAEEAKAAAAAAAVGLNSAQDAGPASEVEVLHSL